MGCPNSKVRDNKGFSIGDCWWELYDKRIGEVIGKPGASVGEFDRTYQTNLYRCRQCGRIEAFDPTGLPTEYRG